MSWEVFASSGYKANPAELFEIRYGDNAEDIVRLTSGDQDVTIGGDEYVSEYASFAEASSEGNSNKGEAIVLTLKRTGLFATVYRSTDFAKAVTLKRLAVDLNDPDLQLYGLSSGRMTHVEFTQTHMVVSFEQMATAQRRSAYTWKYGPQCPHALYYGSCRLTKADWGVTAKIESTNSPTLVVLKEAAAYEDGYFTGGILEFNGVSRFILNHTQKQLEITRTLFGLEDGDGNGVVNQLLFTEEMDNAAWNNNGVVVTPDTYADVNGFLSADLLAGNNVTVDPNLSQPGTASADGELDWTLSAYVREDDAPYIVLSIKNPTTGDQYAVKWSWTEGVLAFDSEPESTGITGGSHALIDEGDGLYRISLSAALTCNKNDLIEGAVFIYYGESGLGGSFVSGTQLEEAAAASTYQRNHGQLGGLPTVALFPGCDRLAPTCNDKFDNLANYGGDDYMPPKGPFEGNSLV
ncbi:phage head spike fiber domain-containing protein [Neptuniibacter sp.]|uniref:phage head spike fiber domain-containing protein n=1 Tax=Neptuniibacter sp. TaxID=1962643 RepID=UPI003B59747F